MTTIGDLFIGPFRKIFKMRVVIYELTKRDFQKQYMGSYLGFVWVFLQPLFMILILFAVFTFGFRAGARSNIPYVVYLISGMISWMYFSENLRTSPKIILENIFLVNNSDFNLSLLPLVKILSAFIPHLFFILLAILVAWYHGYPPSLYTLQISYYFISMALLLVGLSWITSSTSIFINDIPKAISILIQFGFWLTPIVWDIGVIPAKYQWLVKLNPILYITRGYRDSLANNIPFWRYPFEMIYFWSFTGLILFLGITFFRKLRPHFSEVISLK